MLNRDKTEAIVIAAVDTRDVAVCMIKLGQWEQDWSMEFNSDKCEVLRKTRKKNPVIFPYQLHKKELNVNNAAKYLGVIISKDLIIINNNKVFISGHAHESKMYNVQ